MPTDPDMAELEAPSDTDGGMELFPGDRGQLPLETRRVLVQLLLGPSIDARTKPHVWTILLRDEEILRSRLHELFLALVLDRDQRVAFIRQVVDDATDVPVLLRRVKLTFMETALLLFLRQSLTRADAQGDRAVLAREDMADHLDVFKAEAAGDHARFARQIDSAVEKAKKLGLLRKIPGSDERYEVSPALKLLFDAEEIQALTRSYAALADSKTPVSVVDATDEQEDDDA